MATPSQSLGLLTPTLATRASNGVVTDDLKTVTIGNLMDGINAAWNGWEAACKFEDEDMQDYYMKYINLLSDVVRKVRKF